MTTATLVRLDGSSFTVENVFDGAEAVTWAEKEPVPVTTEDLRKAMSRSLYEILHGPPREPVGVKFRHVVFRRDWSERTRAVFREVAS